MDRRIHQALSFHGFQGFQGLGIFLTPDFDMYARLGRNEEPALLKTALNIETGINAVLLQIVAHGPGWWNIVKGRQIRPAGDFGVGFHNV